MCDGVDGMVREVFRWSSIVTYEEVYIDGVPQGIKVVNKFHSQKKEQKSKKKSKNLPKNYVSEEKAEVETR